MAKARQEPAIWRIIACAHKPYSVMCGPANGFSSLTRAGKVTNATEDEDGVEDGEVRRALDPAFLLVVVVQLYQPQTPTGVSG